MLRPCQPPSSPGVTVPRRSQLAQEMWLVAASLWVSAAVFCLVTDALEMRFMTSSFLPTNRKRSRGEVFLPLRLCCFTRVSERARAEGVGEISSTVARMSGEAPPSCLYIKGWRDSRRRHFALEQSNVQNGWRILPAGREPSSRQRPPLQSTSIRLDMACVSAYDRSRRTVQTT